MTVIKLTTSASLRSESPQDRSPNVAMTTHLRLVFGEYGEYRELVDTYEFIVTPRELLELLQEVNRG